MSLPEQKEEAGDAHVGKHELGESSFDDPLESGDEGKLPTLRRGIGGGVRCRPWEALTKPSGRDDHLPRS